MQKEEYILTFICSYNIIILYEEVMVVLVNRAYKFRMYPNAEQIELINKTIGCSRLVYNIMLSKKKENSKLSKFDMIREIPKLYNEYPFLKEVDSCSLRCAVFDLENGYNKYYKRQGGYPKFKRKGIKDI